MASNFCLKFKHDHVLTILFLLLVWLNYIATVISEGNQVETAVVMNKKCIDKERRALLDIKALKLQDPYVCVSPWGSGEEDDCCEWSGVSCNNETGHVTELVLSPCHLKVFFIGTIPMSIGSLTQLTHLDLSDNYFIGTIPMSIGSLTQLRHLDLSYNSFTGTIPMSIGSLTELSYLGLSGNSFNGTIPLFIGSLTELTYLYLAQNSFSGTIPGSIGSVTKLRNLDLSDNLLYGTIPPEFGNLTNLRQLDLTNMGSCRVENLDWLSYLSHLQHLKMDGVSLAKANHWVNILTSLQNLAYLSLKRCNLSQVMYPYSSSYVNSSFTSSSIVYLYLGDNNLNSSISHWLFPLTSNMLSANLLKIIDLSSNNLKGKIPNELTDLRGLVELNLSSNALLGGIPQNIGLMKELQILDLSRNNLSGGLPSYMSLMTSLTHLDVSYNNFSGKIPSSTQLQSFEPSRYTGNAGLCGPPLIIACLGDKEPIGESHGDGEDRDELQRWFYIGGTTGFAIGFWIVCSTLLVNRRGIHTFFQFLDSLEN